MFFRYNEFSVWLFQMVLAAVTATQDQACRLVPQPGETPPPLEQSAANTETAPPPPSTADLSLSRWVGCPELIDLPSRGLACLHCTQPEAHSQADALVQIMLESCVKNVAVNYLIDGSFSTQPELLRRHVEALSADGRKLTIVFYLANGPSQRRHDGDPLPGFGTSIAPEVFRERIQSDPALREQFRKLVESYVPLFQYVNSRGAELRIIPMLEDNLDRESFLAMSEIVTSVIPQGLFYRMGRNPCGCSDANDREIPDGYFEETHSMERAANVKGGVITNDGDTDSSPSDLAKARDRAGKAGSVFLLWSAERQGLVARGGGSFSRSEASEREYAMPDFKERAELIRFLRGN